jgi:hypothetical protein
LSSIIPREMRTPCRASASLSVKVVRYQPTPSSPSNPALSHRPGTASGVHPSSSSAGSAQAARPSIIPPSVAGSDPIRSRSDSATAASRARSSCSIAAHALSVMPCAARLVHVSTLAPPQEVWMMPIGTPVAARRSRAK